MAGAIEMGGISLGESNGSASHRIVKKTTKEDYERREEFVRSELARVPLNNYKKPEKLDAYMRNLRA